MSGAISWVGKQSQLSAKLVSLCNGLWLITQAITKGHIKPRGPGHPRSIPPASTPFNLHDQQTSQKLLSDGRCPDLATGQYTRSEVGCHSEAEIKAKDNESYGWPHHSCLHSHQIVDLKVTKVQCQLPLSVSSMSERLGSPRHSCHGQWSYRESGGHMKISQLVFKDEDTKDTVTYQSWCWDLTVYHCTGYRDCSLLPYAIHSLQGYPGELVRSSGTDITLDDVLTILDEHYNNVEALNQELFQLHMGKKRQCQTGECAYRDTFGFSWHHLQNVFLWTT